MRFGWAVLAIAAFAFAPAGAGADCPSENSAAIQMANEGDQLRATNLDGAIEKYKGAVDLDPASHRILSKLAAAYEKKEDWPAVDATLAKAIPLAPKHAGYLVTRGIALAHQRKWAEARPLFERAIAIDPNRSDAHAELADAALHLGDEKTALVHYTKAIELAPRDVSAYVALADLYLRLGLDAHAEKTLATGEANVTDESKKLALYTLHGDVRSNRQDLAGAIEKYEAAKRACGTCTEPGQHIIYFDLGAAYASLAPPRKSEAAANLTAFIKMVCRGAAAARYADPCAQAQRLLTSIGGAP